MSDRAVRQVFTRCQSPRYLSRPRRDDIGRGGRWVPPSSLALWQSVCCRSVRCRSVRCRSAHRRRRTHRRKDVGPPHTAPSRRAACSTPTNSRTREAVRRPITRSRRPRPLRRRRCRCHGRGRHRDGRRSGGSRIPHGMAIWTRHATGVVQQLRRRRDPCQRCPVEPRHRWGAVAVHEPVGAHHRRRHGRVFPATDATAGRYVPLTPLRALDTRDGGAAPAQPNGRRGPHRRLPAGVPADATAMAVVLTITQARAAGFVTAYPAGSSNRGRAR